ncbi:MAG: hypothetical protein ACREQW_07580 [Candidatus Binatia bacterium]
MSSTKQQKVLVRLESENIEEKIEVIAGEDNPPFLEIRSLRWGRGIGWYVQKTITLDAIQAKMLMHTLRRSAVASATKSRKGNVIPFPASVLRQ